MISRTVCGAAAVRESKHTTACWLTGLDADRLEQLEAEGASFERLFEAATLNPKVGLTAGLICGVRGGGDRQSADAEGAVHGQAGG